MTTYEHFNNGNITGCYAVIAVDSDWERRVNTAIQSASTMTPVRFTHCPMSSRPTTIMYNDIYHPFPYTSVERVEMTIFNRWGNIVYRNRRPGYKLGRPRLQE
ncbi:MAG: gliding motility-associated C-terminal domain-containing protein [Marinilabiliales bacterium]|nr:gliding motility-associated C-terminal domain-containing protein [Marinilabiliales bacterium]